MLKANDIFDKYHILEPIGKGGMAIVYKAESSDGQLVALKLLADNLSMDEDIRHRFTREARIMSQLNHRGIVSVLDYGELDGRPYLVMEYMSRGSLDQYFRDGVRITVKQSMRLLKQICAALDYAHSRTEDENKQGVIHRDLKLDNILIDNNRRVALSDFGLARIQDGTRMSVSGMMLGTMMYISPEQIRSFKGVDFHTDIYALGVIFYLISTGYFPFTGETREEFIIKHTTHQPPKPTEVNPDLPETVDTVILRALAKDPNDRYDSASEMLKAYQRAMRHHLNLEVEVKPMVENPTRSQPMRFSQALKQNQDTSRNRFTIAFVGLITIIAILFGLVAAIAVSQSAGSEVLPTQDPRSIAFSILTETAESWTETPTFTMTPVNTVQSTAQETLPPTWTPTATYTTTFTPTATITSTQTPTPEILLYDALVLPQVGVNMRNGAGTEYSLVRVIPQDTELTIIGRTQDSQWYQVQTPENMTGWVAGEFIERYVTDDLIAVTWETDPIVVNGSNTSTTNQSTTSTQNTGSTSNTTTSSSNTTTSSNTSEGATSSSSSQTTDTDGDGYPDSSDNCPTQGSIGYGVDSVGCPIPPTSAPGATSVVVPTNTRIPPTPLPPTATVTPVPPSKTPIPTNTQSPPTPTPVPTSTASFGGGGADGG